MLSKWFWRGFLRGLTKPWSIFTDPPGYWQKKIRASVRVRVPKQVVAVEDWGWWFKVGETYTVRPFKYKATRGATIDYCFCLECQEERAGKEMFDMYECLDDAHRGSIIPVVACRDVVRVNADNEGER